MKLYNVPNNSRIRILGDVKIPPCAPELSIGDELNFKHIDGMYSYCTNDKDEVVHLAAWAEVDLVKE